MKKILHYLHIFLSVCCSFPEVSTQFREYIQSKNDILQFSSSQALGVTVKERYVEDE